MNSLTLSEILAPRELPREAVDVPELGGTVFIRALRADERDRLDAHVFRDGNRDLTNFRARMVAYAICDAQGNSLCSDPEKEAPQLGSLSSSTIGRMYDAAKRLNGLTVDDAEKNS